MALYDDRMPSEQGATRRAGGLERPPPRPTPGYKNPHRDRYGPKRHPGVGTPPIPKPAPQAGYQPIGGSRAVPASLGRRVGRVVARHVLGRALDLTDVIQPWLDPSPFRVPDPRNGWRMCFMCPPWPINHTQYSNLGVCTPAIANLSCLGGQALSANPGTAGVPSGYQPPPTDPSLRSVRYGYATPIGNPPVGYRQRYVADYFRPASSTSLNAEPLDAPYLAGGWALTPEINPNVMRYLPSVPQVGYGQGLAPREVTADELAQRLDAAPSSSTAITAGGSLNPPSGGSGRQSTSTFPPKKPEIGNNHERKKPPRNVRERKMRGPVMLGLMLADVISESAEVVDAVFEALPKDVQKKWDCNRSAAFIDKAGQYGIDNADCKARALWHNWHKVDIVEAVRNIIANQVEDKLIGYLHKNAPRNLINAGEDGQKAYAELVKAFLEEIGLQDGEGFDGMKGPLAKVVTSK